MFFFPLRRWAEAHGVVLVLYRDGTVLWKIEEKHRVLSRSVACAETAESEWIKLRNGVVYVYLSTRPSLFLCKQEHQFRYYQMSATLVFAVGLTHKHKQLLFQPQNVPPIPNPEATQRHRNGSP